MPNLLVKPNGASGKVHDITPQSAGWTHVGFALHRLGAGESVSEATDAREVCLVLVAGKATVTVDGEDLGELGARMTPFEGAPYSVYVPMGATWTVTATTGLDLAVCSAPGGPGFKAQVIRPGRHPQMTRGKATNTRYVTNIMPEDDGAAQSLLVVEVITPGGHTSSYPPHKHDEDNLPAESFLEETYYHRLNPSQGFAMQRVYTDDRSLDETMAVEDGDVTLVPRGYHPVAAIHGYDLYYLNVMAGPVRAWKFNNAKEHAWLFTGV